MYIQDDGMRLHIKIDRPEGEKCPLVVVIHGFTGHMEEEHITAVSGRRRFFPPYAFQVAVECADGDRLCPQPGVCH